MFYVLVVYYVVCFFPVLLLRVSSDNIVFVRIRWLRPFVLFMDPPFFLVGSQARWPYPRNHFYLCLLVDRSIAMPMLWYLPHALSCLPYFHVKPLTHHVLANRCLSMLPLCSAPLIALLVAGEDWRPFLVGTLFTCWDIIIFPCYLNASIYLVKGGRLGLLPSVLFHYCRPSFCHIGVMFPDFAFLTRLGYNGNPLIVRLDQSFSSKAQPWFYYLH